MRELNEVKWRPGPSVNIIGKLWLKTVVWFWPITVFARLVPFHTIGILVLSTQTKPSNGDKRFTEVTQLISYKNEGTASAEELLPVPYVLPTALLPHIEDRSNKNATKWNFRAMGPWKNLEQYWWNWYWNAGNSIMFWNLEVAKRSQYALGSYSPVLPVRSIFTPCRRYKKHSTCEKSAKTDLDGIRHEQIVICRSRGGLPANENGGKIYPMIKWIIL